jgi:hypothetical protein
MVRIAAMSCKPVSREAADHRDHREGRDDCEDAVAQE